MRRRSALFSFSLALVAWCALAALFGRASSAAPPTLRISVDGANEVERIVFAQALAKRLTVMRTWSIEFGVPLIAAPCLAAAPRAGLEVDLASLPSGMVSATTRLVDCARWPIAAWEFTVPTGELGLRRLAAEVQFALRLWQHHETTRFAALFDMGDASARDGICRAEMNLVKTSDGQMRVVVRPGGPAYTAGLRTNDVILRIDGRDWWDYGTYQAQQRAGDGLSHTYVRADSERLYRVACPG